MSFEPHRNQQNQEDDAQYEPDRLAPRCIFLGNVLLAVRAPLRILDDVAAAMRARHRSRVQVPIRFIILRVLALVEILIVFVESSRHGILLEPDMTIAFDKTESATFVALYPAAHGVSE